MPDVRCQCQGHRRYRWALIVSPRHGTARFRRQSNCWNSSPRCGNCTEANRPGSNCASVTHVNFSLSARRCCKPVLRRIHRHRRHRGRHRCSPSGICRPHRHALTRRPDVCPQRPCRAEPAPAYPYRRRRQDHLRTCCCHTFVTLSEHHRHRIQ